jgi:hypothetical protein
MARELFIMLAQEKGSQGRRLRGLPRGSGLGLQDLVGVWQQTVKK